MKELPLSQGKVAIVDDDVGEEITRYKWSFYGRYAFRRYVRGKKVTKVYMHRLILGLRFGDRVDCDHINGNTLDNRRANLRLATRSENNGNQRKTRGISRYKGVYWNRGVRKWQAQIRIHGHRTYLGIFRDERDAAAAYNRAAVTAFGEFARLNEL